MQQAAEKGRGDSEISGFKRNVSVGTFAPVSQHATVYSRTPDASMTFEGQNAAVQEGIPGQSAPGMSLIERQLIQICQESDFSETASFKFSNVSTPN